MKNYSYALIGMLGLLLIAGGLYYASKKGPEPAGGDNKMTFFVTSDNPGRGGNLGGLNGADEFCQRLASSTGAGGLSWRAYLSAVASGTEPAVNARDRIGDGPWHNAKGVLIAENVDQLHDGNGVSKEAALDERGVQVKGRGDAPNQHDILTGSDPDGRVVATSTDTTCGNWIKSEGGSAIVGHHDRIGLRDDAPSKSWNSSHYSRGCSLNELAASGGGGLFYCFAR